MTDHTGGGPTSGLLIPAAAVADALVRLGLAGRAVPPALQRLERGGPVIGPAVVTGHFGSVDVFLEAFAAGPPGSILVIDNGGRLDEACVGDLVVGDAKVAGFGAILIWGAHRDSSALREIGLPIWSLGSCPLGPRGVRGQQPAPPEQVRLAEVEVRRGDVIVADDDGFVVVSPGDWPRVAIEAERIWRTEARQAERLRAGESMREQLDFAAYQARRRQEPDYTFRQHLLDRGGAIET